jgi:hypothetical protein
LVLSLLALLVRKYKYWRCAAASGPGVRCLCLGGFWNVARMDSWRYSVCLLY